MKYKKYIILITIILFVFIIIYLQMVKKGNNLYNEINNTDIVLNEENGKYTIFNKDSKTQIEVESDSAIKFYQDNPGEIE